MAAPIRWLPLAATTLTLAACALPQQVVSQKSDMEVCKSYGVFKRGLGFQEAARQMRDEIERRKLMTEADWEQAATGRIRIGMKQCAMYAVWGGPDRENRSVGSYGVRIQHVYNSGLRYVKPTYVYTSDGVVTGFQD